MHSILNFLDRSLSHPLVMLATIVVLLIYTVATKRLRHLPRIPFGLLIFYLVVRFVWLLLRNIESVGHFEVWIQLIASIILAWALIRLLFALVVDFFLHWRGKTPLPKITRDFILLTCYAIIALVLLRTQGDVNLAGLITTSAVLTAIVGLAAQSTLSSLFSGLTLQLERPFSVGDWIGFGDYIGQVVGITWKSTLLQTREEELVFIPNTDFATKYIRNFSRPTQRHQAHLSLGVEYNAAPNHVRSAILSILSQHPRVLTTPAPEIRLKEFGDFAVIYDIVFWHRDFGAEPKLKTEINNQLWYCLRRHNIRIPFPVRDIQHSHIERRRELQEGELRRSEIGRLLKQTPILTPLSPDELDLLSKRKIELHGFGDGEFIVRQGDAGDSLFIIRYGTCEVLLKVGEQEPHVVATMGAGQFFGEMSLLTGAPRSATVRAKGDVEVLVIDKDDFGAILAANPEISTKLAEVLATRQMDLATKEGEFEKTATPHDLVSRIKSFFGIH